MRQQILLSIFSLYDAISSGVQSASGSSAEEARQIFLEFFAKGELLLFYGRNTTKLNGIVLPEDAGRDNLPLFSLPPLETAGG